MTSYDDLGLEASRFRDLDNRLTKLEQAHAHSGSRAAKAILDLKGLEELGSAAEARLEIGDEDPFETLIVLGYKDDVYFTINRTDGTDWASQDVVVEIPEGTTRVIAFMRGWLAGYAETTSSETSIRDLVDHHLGVAYLNVRVREVGQRTATLRAAMLLRDINGDDPWTGWVNAVAIYMGPHP